MWPWPSLSKRSIQAGGAAEAAQEAAVVVEAGLVPAVKAILDLVLAPAGSVGAVRKRIPIPNLLILNNSMETLEALDRILNKIMEILGDPDRILNRIMDLEQESKTGIVL